jgi:hypothetical protein
MTYDEAWEQLFKEALAKGMNKDKAEVYAEQNAYYESEAYH